MEKQDNEIRILILGKTGSGKSATGNTILNDKFFPENCLFESSDKESKRGIRKLDNRTIFVIDTPGVCSTAKNKTEIINQIRHGIKCSYPGVHIILLVIKLDSKFTEEEKNAVEFFQRSLGTQARDHTMVLFTHGDTLEEPDQIETHLHSCQRVKNVVYESNSVYQVFNNKSRDQTQVTELLEKIDQIMKKRKNRLYTTEMFEEVQRNHDESEHAKAERERKQFQKELEKSQTMYTVMGITTALAVGGLAVAGFAAMALLKK